MRSPAWPTLLFALVGAAVAAGCDAYPTAPGKPAYDTEVRPLLMAHCVRCHGAGGSLNVPTEPTGPNAPTLPSISGVVDAFNSVAMYFDQFDTTGDCSASPPTDCKNGAGPNAGAIKTFVQPQTKPPLFMPPAPAPALNDWELGVINNWAANPVCSNSSVPDPTICPNGPGVAM
jgi:cytochrome c553